MLNYNKIESAINYEKVPKTKLATFLGIGESTFRSRLERKNLTPDDVAKIAEYFKRPISYYFDKEENETNESSEKYTVTRVDCPECIKKLNTINDLRKTIALQDELLEKYRPKKEEDYG